VNRGIGQETTAEALLRVPAIAAMRPSKVFILYGNNDFGVVSPAESAANLRNFIFGLRSLSPATEIYLQSLLPPPSFTREAWVSQVNELFKQTADEHHLHWIDLCPNFRNGRVIDPKFTVDGIHLTPEGYKVWRRALQPYVFEHTTPLLRPNQALW